MLSSDLGLFPSLDSLLLPCRVPGIVLWARCLSAGLMLFPAPMQSCSEKWLRIAEQLEAVINWIWHPSSTTNASGWLELFLIIFLFYCFHFELCSTTALCISLCCTFSLLPAQGNCSLSCCVCHFNFLSSRILSFLSPFWLFGYVIPICPDISINSLLHYLCP